MDPVPFHLRVFFGLTGRVAPEFAARAMAALVSRPRGRNPTQPWEVDLAAAGREIELQPGLFAESWGETGPIVLALHGWRGRTSQFRPLAAALLARGLRTIAVDLPGHGRSTGEQATPRLMGELLMELDLRIGPLHAAIGHSFGGASIGAALAFGFRPARMVLASSPTRVSRIPFIYAKALGLPPRAMPHLERILDDHAGRRSAELDLVVTAPRRHIPSLLIHDREDAVIPYSAAENLIAEWPELEVLTTRGLGHRDILSNADVLQRITDFVSMRV